MTSIIKPILETEDNYFELTLNRLSLLVMPIQKTKKKKESDFLAFLTNPVLDWFLFPTIYTVDMVIHLCNAIASLAKAAYIWSLRQQESAVLLDEETKKELHEAVSHFLHACSSYLAKVVNCWLSLLSLVTRPIVSLVYFVFEPLVSLYKQPHVHSENQHSPPHYANSSNTFFSPQPTAPMASPLPNSSAGGYPSPWVQGYPNSIYPSLGR